LSSIFLLASRASMRISSLLTILVT
jgi:hypothetical protein